MRKKLLFVALALVSTLSAISSKAETIFGLTSSSQVFIMANASSPSSITGPYSVTGMASGESLIALDFNQANGTLYALAYDSIMMKGRMYIINTTTWSASAVGSAAVSMNLDNGKNTGFDFMATTSNMVRVVASNGNNYVLNAADGSINATGSSSISYAPSDIHFGSAANIGATAYTNSFYGADATTEVGYDVTNNSVVTFDNTNMYYVHTNGLSGVLINAGSSVGIDAYYDATTHNNTVYLSATPVLGAGAVLYTVNTTSGAATSVGVIGSGTINVRDIAVQVNRNVPATVTGQLVIGLTLNMRNLIFFDSDQPGIIRNSVALHGMASGQVMMAISINPQNKKLYGIAYNSATTEYQLYIIDTATGNVTAVNSTAGTLNLGANSNAGVGMAFNPQSGYLHITGNGGLNVQINATTGLVAVTDSNMHYASGDLHFGSATNIGSISFTNGYVGATSTQMTGIDFNTGVFVNLSAGSHATLNTILDISALLGLGANSNGNIDYYYDSSTGTDKAYMSSNANGMIGGVNNYGKFYTSGSGSVSTTPTYVGDVNTPVKSMAVQKRYTGTTGIATVNGTTATDLLVYPNPVTDRTHIVLSAPAKYDVTVDVVDMNGHVVRTFQYAAGSTRLDVDMSNMPIGHYMANVKSKDQLQNVQLLKLQ